MLLVAMTIPMFSAMGLALEEIYKTELFPAPELEETVFDNYDDCDLEPMVDTAQCNLKLMSFRHSSLASIRMSHQLASAKVFSIGENSPPSFIWDIDQCFLDYIEPNNPDNDYKKPEEMDVLPFISADNFTTTPMVDGGFAHTIALRYDGTVWAWGENIFGQLGDGTTISRHTPVRVQGLNNITAISAGGGHTVALKNDGTVWAWGFNGAGHLGDGTTINRSTPVRVQGLSNVIAISAGGDHTVALRNDGTVWAWGWNEDGQLGDGTITHRITPVRLNSLSNIVAIVGGWEHTAAIRGDGTVWTWGANENGQLGDGTNIRRLAPVRVQNINNAVAISAGSWHTVAIRSNGTVSAWGANNGGQLGDGTTIERRTPVQVQGLNNVVTITAGNEYSIAIRDNGTVWTWGWNGNGQFGNGTTTARNIPVQVHGFGDVMTISTGVWHTIAIRNDGTVWTCGWNELGKLGDGTAIDRRTPVQVRGVGGVGFLNLLPTLIPIWSTNTNSITFPSLTAGYTAQAAQTTNITNSGPGVLSGVTASITAGSANFQITQSPSITVQASASSLVQIRPVTGLSPGTYTGTLRISTTNGNPAHRDIPLSFTVTSPPIIWSSSTPSITFLAATVGYSTQTAQSVTINNSGHWALNGVTASITAGSANFQITQSPSTTVQAGATSTIQVRPVSGLTIGTHTGTLRISSTNGDPVHRDIPLSFTVTPPPVWSINLNSISFPIANAGYSPQISQSITITNNGPGRLNNVTATVSSPNFLITQSPLSNILADGTSTIQVRPATGLLPGTYADTLRISSSNGNPAYVEIPLSFIVMPDTEPNSNFGWVTPRFDAIVNRGWLPGDMDGNGIFNSTDVLIARQIGNPSNSRTTASTLAEFSNHDLLYLFNTLRNVDLPDMSERFATIVLEEFMLGDITGTRTFTPTDILIIRQLANPANTRTRECIIADFPVHYMIYLFGALSSLLN